MVWTEVEDVERVAAAAAVRAITGRVAAAVAARAMAEETMAEETVEETAVV